MRQRLLLVLPVLLLATVVPAPPVAAAPQLTPRVVQQGLTNPWDVVFTPAGRMLVSERPGRVRVYASGRPGAARLSTLTIPNVRAEGESGVMGLAAAVRSRRTYVFVCVSRQDRGLWRNQILRYRFSSDRLVFDRYVLRWGLRANTIHNGCALGVGRDGKLWVGTGDVADLSTPQNGRSLNGKVLRMNLDGSVPDTNPGSGSLVYTRGHRNVQGLAFQPGTGRVYAVEHGPDVHDEVNRLVAGGNYGWPCYAGPNTPYAARSGCKSAGSYRRPAWSSGSSTIATSGATFASGDRWSSFRGDLFISTLKESDVRRLNVSADGTRAYSGSVFFDGRWGRLRGAVLHGPTQALYLTTSNGDGNDRIVRVLPGG